MAADLRVQLFDVLKSAPIGRLGYHAYTHIQSTFELFMPLMEDDNVSGNIVGGEVPDDSSKGVTKEQHKRNMEIMQLTNGV